MRQLRHMVVGGVLLLMLLPAFSQTDDMTKGLQFYKEGRFKEALPIFHKLAQEGNASAQYQLCLMFKRGQGMKKPDPNEATVWCKKSADQGYALAEHEMATNLQSGNNTSSSLEYYKKAAKQGVPEAQYTLGKFYEFGEGGVQQSYYQARTLYMWASAQGYSPATYRVGVIYEEGKGVRPSMVAAIRWYEKAAGMGNEEAKAKLELIKQQEEEMEQMRRNQALIPEKNAVTP